MITKRGKYYDNDLTKSPHYVDIEGKRYHFSSAKQKEMFNNYSFDVTVRYKGRFITQFTLNIYEAYVLSNGKLTDVLYDYVKDN